MTRPARRENRGGERTWIRPEIADESELSLCRSCSQREGCPILEELSDIETAHGAEVLVASCPLFRP